MAGKPSRRWTSDVDLGEYLAAARTKPWKWREHDCSAFPAAWAGFSGALPQYSTEAEAEALLHAAGGLVPLWEKAADGRADEVALSELQPGDVGVIEMPAPREGTEPAIDGPIIIIDSVEIGAIWTGRRWAFVPMAGGVAAVSGPTVLKAWRPKCPKQLCM